MSDAKLLELLEKQQAIQGQMMNLIGAYFANQPQPPTPEQIANWERRQQVNEDCQAALTRECVRQNEALDAIACRLEELVYNLSHKPLD